MYLLNQISDKSCLGKKADLHSTMYLLNPYILMSLYAPILKFTFHYVSIKSLTGIDNDTITEIYIPLCIY